MRVMNDDRVIDEIIPQLTKGGGDCAFHAVLGRWDDIRKEFVCNDVAEKRKFMANVIRSCKLEDALFLLIGEAIKAGK